MIATAVDVGRDAAREAAQRELSKPEYHRDDPSLVQRAGQWALDRIHEVLDRADQLAPGGRLGLLVLVLLVVLVVVVLVVRVGGVRRTATSGAVLLAGRTRTAAEHRAEAETAAAQGRFDVAIRERLRAVARELEDRGVLDPRPGRTADELVADAGRALPELAAGLRDAARVFDDVWYGGRTGTAAGYATVREADERVRTARTAAAVHP